MQHETEFILKESIPLFGDTFPLTFLEAGAVDGRMESITLRLEELGWEGVCVEPDPSFILDLARYRKHVLNAVLYNGGWVMFKVAEIGLSRILRDGENKINTYWTSSILLDDVIERYTNIFQSGIGVMVLDLEHSEEVVIAHTSDETLSLIRILIIERPTPYIYQTLDRLNFEVNHIHKENTIFLNSNFLLK